MNTYDSRGQRNTYKTKKDVRVLLCSSLTQAFAAYLEDKQRS